MNSSHTGSFVGNVTHDIKVWKNTILQQETQEEKKTVRMTFRKLGMLIFFVWARLCLFCPQVNARSWFTGLLDCFHVKLYIGWCYNCTFNFKIALETVFIRFCTEVISLYRNISFNLIQALKVWETPPPRVTYVAGIQTGRADQSGPHGDKELLAGQAGELEKPKGRIHGAKISCANNTNWDQAPVCQRSVRGSFVDWAPCFWHCVSVEGQIFTENFSPNVKKIWQCVLDLFLPSSLL